MEVRMLRSLASHRWSFYAGQVVDVSDRLAGELVGAGAAELVHASSPKEERPPAEVQGEREVEPGPRAPKRRGRRR